MLDTLPDPHFDRLAALAAEALGCPVGLIVFLDETNAWFKAKAIRSPEIVLSHDFAPRSCVLCDYAVATGKTLVVPDTRRHPIAHSRAMPAPSEFPFYAGALLRDGNGTPVGTLSVLDTRPRRFSSAQIARLEEYAALVEREINRLPSPMGIPALDAPELPSGFFDAFPLPMWVYDAETLRFLEVNRCALLHYGYTRDEFRAMTIRDIRPPEQRPLLDARLRAIAGRFDPTQFHNSRSWRHRTKAGNVIDVEVQSRDMVYHGRRARLVAVLDVTERRRASRAWQMVHSSVESASDGYAVRDKTGWFYSNAALTALTGYTREEIDAAGYVLRLLCRAEEAERVGAAIERGESWAGELEIRTKDGNFLTAAVRANPVRDEQGEIIGRFTVFTNVTEKKRVERALVESRQRYKSLFDYCPDAIIHLDAAGVYQSVNAAVTVLSGYAMDDLRGRNFIDMILPEDQARAAVLFARTMHGEPTSWELRVRHKDGRVLLASGLSVPAVVNGQVVGTYSIVRDITEQRAVVEQLRESEERFRQLIENTSDIISIAERDGTIRYESPSVERVLGYRPEELVGTDSRLLMHPADLSLVQGQSKDVFSQPGESRVVEARFRHKDGSWRHLECVVTNLLDQPGVRGLVVNARDVTERKQSEELLGFLAHHDALTDLPNRLKFSDQLDVALDEARACGGTLAVLFLDLDRFKVINDTLGHSVGDLLLRAVAERLRSLTRPDDTVARWGGDEFTFVLARIPGAPEAAETAQAIIAALSEIFVIQENELYITATIGISLYPGGGEDGETLVRNADTAMYRAKEQGKNYYQLYTPAMTAGALERLTLENSLRRAVERDELILHYQPQVETATGGVTGVEALVRWQHPLLGLLSPGEFIPLAEETGLIVPIGAWVLRTACLQAKRWHEAGFEGLRVAVNLSAHQIRRKEFVSEVGAALAESGLDAEALELELTESALMDDEPHLVQALLDLRATGVHLTIDDFGTGYSSFVYLKRYPVRALKIDQSFVRGVTSDDDDAAIVEGIMALATNLRLRTVAEGVETKAQLEFLHRRGCTEMQGFYFSAPVPAASILPLLQMKAGRAKA